MKLFPISGWRQWLPCSITLLALFSGFFSIIFVFYGIITGEHELVNTGCMLIYLAWIFDSFDGAVARWVKGTSVFGAELDTFVDFLSFSVAPAVLVFAVTLPGQALAVRALFPTLMVASGAMRLSKFRVTDAERGLKGYTGLPVTLIAGFVAMWIFLLLPEKGLTLLAWAQGVLFLSVATAIILQVSGIHYPAPTKKPVVMIPVILLFVVFALLWWFESQLAFWWGMGMVVLGYGYSILYPFLQRKVQKN
jgi:CDP-diacylglycerol---serine O-phosphatidyltransferase